MTGVLRKKNLSVRAPSTRCEYGRVVCARHTGRRLPRSPQIESGIPGAGRMSVRAQSRPVAGSRKEKTKRPRGVRGWWKKGWDEIYRFTFRGGWPAVILHFIEESDVKYIYGPTIFSPALLPSTRPPAYVGPLRVIASSDGFPGQEVSHFSPLPPPTGRVIRHTHEFRVTAVEIYRFANDKAVGGWTSGTLTCSSAISLYGKITPNAGSRYTVQCGVV